jgi:hypothetical protein
MQVGARLGAVRRIAQGYLGKPYPEMKMSELVVLGGMIILFALTWGWFKLMEWMLGRRP